MLKGTFASARILSFCSSPSRFFFSVCLPVLPPSSFLLAQQAKTHTHCIAHKKKGDSVMRTEGCNWSKSRICLCAYLENNTVQNNKTSLHFNVVFLSFLCSFIFSCWCIHYQALRNPFCFFVIQMKSHHRSKKVLRVKTFLLTRLSVFLLQTRLFCV